MPELTPLQPGQMIPVGHIAGMTGAVNGLLAARPNPGMPGTSDGRGNPVPAIPNPARRVRVSRVVVVGRSWPDEPAGESDPEAGAEPLMRDVLYDLWSEATGEVLPYRVPHTMREVPGVSAPILDTVRVYPAATIDQTNPSGPRYPLHAEGVLYEFVDAAEPSDLGLGGDGVAVVRLFGEQIAAKVCS